MNSARSSLGLACCFILFGLASTVASASVIVNPASPTAAAVSGTISTTNTTNVTSSCALHLDCKSCAADPKCGYCAYAGPDVQGQGTCMNRTVETCAWNVGSYITSTDQCALPNDTCSNYQSIYSCSIAPLSLNCGWCATGLNGDRSHACLAGNFTQSNGYDCPYGAWGYQSRAGDSTEAMCNALSGPYSCSNCFDSSPNCGYCLTTGLCEMTAYGEITPIGNDCSVNGSSYYAAFSTECPTPVDTCVYNYDCATCAQQIGCGWCNENGGSCSAGSSFGPTVTYCALVSADWFYGPYATCPASTQTCESVVGCSTCAATFGCGWCQSSSDSTNGYCTGASSSGPLSPNSCDGSYYFDMDPTKCPSPGGSTTDSYPVAGVMAMVSIGLIFIYALVSIALFTCARRCEPTYGIRILNHPTIDSTSTGHRIFPFLMIVLSLGLKLAALGLDQWDRDSSSSSDGGPMVYFGLLRYRASQGGETDRITYHDLCALFNVPDAPGSDVLSQEYSVCITGRIGGIVTLVCGILSSLMTLICLLYCISNFCSPSSLPVTVRLQWRSSALMTIFSTSTCLYWSLVGHQCFHHLEGGATLFISVIIFALAMIVDVFMLFYFRHAVQSTPDPTLTIFSGAQQIQGGLDHALLNPRDSRSDAMMNRPMMLQVAYNSPYHQYQQYQPPQQSF